MQVPGATVHWYGKTEVTCQRKVGHVTITAATAAEARARLAKIDPAAAKSLESTAPAAAATAASPSTATPRVRCVQLRALALRSSPVCLSISAADLPGRNLAPKDHGSMMSDLAGGLAGGCDHGFRLGSGDHGSCGTGALKQDRSQHQHRSDTAAKRQPMTAAEQTPLPVLLRSSRRTFADYLYSAMGPSGVCSSAEKVSCIAHG